MRRFTVVPFALLLVLAVAAPVAAGPSVSNQSGSYDVANGYWGSYDDTTGSFTSGEIQVAKGDGQTFFYLHEESGTYVDCSSGKPGKDRRSVSPYDTTGDYGFKGTQTFGKGGDATLSLTFGRRLSGATASGTISIETVAVDDCAGTYETVKAGDETLALTLTGTGLLVSTKDTSSIKVPAALNGHLTQTVDDRTASGTADFGRGSRAIDGDIAHVTWRDHCNGTC
jgi:hypothetical protein